MSVTTRTKWEDLRAGDLILIKKEHISPEDHSCFEGRGLFDAVCIVVFKSKEHAICGHLGKHYEEKHRINLYKYDINGIKVVGRRKDFSYGI